MTAEDQVVALFVAANPVPDPDLLDPLDLLDPPPGWGDVSLDPQLHRPEPTRPVRPRLMPLVAAVAMMAFVGLGVWFFQDSRSEGPASLEEVGQPALDGPTLLAPPADLDGLLVNEAAHGRSATGFVRGAVRTPSDEIIGITIIGEKYGGGLGGTMTVGGQDVAVAKGAGDVRWGYTVWGNCIALGETEPYSFWVDITTSDGLEPVIPPRFPQDVETFFRQLTITGTTVTARLPQGWESLGAAATSDRYTLHFSASVPALAPVSEFQLDQRPETGVGVFLADPRGTNPRPTTLSGRPAWLITGPGQWITLVFDRDGTAVLLRGRGVNEEQLVAFAATLVPQPWSETAALLTGTNPTPPLVEEQLPERVLPLPADCDVSLELVEDGPPTTPTS